MSQRPRLGEQSITKQDQQRDDERKIERVSMAKGVNLDVKIPEGYTGRWVNASIEGRVDRLLQAGYEFKVDADGNQIKRSKGGSDLILMIVPTEFYKEDISIGQRKVDALVNEQQRLGKDEYTTDGRSVLSRDSVI